MSLASDAWKVLRPGGPIWGLNPKTSFITPVDFIPIVGPANKVRQGRKAWKSRESIKRFAHGAFGLAGDIALVLGLGVAANALARRSPNQGLGAPLSASPTRTERSSRCPAGHFWDSRKQRCVRRRPGKR